ncbi:hypothetical protein H6G51_03550 [Limnothrix sp. FACHB-708]|uniref:hypothetical protein n=1 Tax=unclassified Limnothrix TaxID=2632864 RepID=UPI001688B18F|nr:MULTISPECIES: hypothetical protein [unclassified Limnothrix]MBD2552347.1 hypothetical protein [Limnothrix sp. FACHB-708]MBD2590213.1 hypothetical protein [Limnothrix sp. FACHB-406]
MRLNLGANPEDRYDSGGQSIPTLGEVLQQIPRWARSPFARSPSFVCGLFAACLWSCVA